MATEEQIRESLNDVPIPGAERNVNQLNLVRSVSVNDGAVSVTIASSALSEEVQNWVKVRTEAVVKRMPDVSTVEVEFEALKATDVNNIKNIIAIMSGKGGVGKSLVASLTALSLSRQGYSVGILDADITGPSIPKMFGITERPSGSDTGILPVLSKAGIATMSINLLLPDEGEAVIWRGPLISNAIKQFGNDVLWGNLDYLIIDLPPGTADAPLTVLQSFPVTGVIIVYTPQDLVDMIVRKAVSMAKKMNKKVLGVVENMSYLYVPEIDKKIEIFGKSRGEDMAKAADAPLLGVLPIDPSLAKLCDEGNIEKYSSDAITDFSNNLNKTVNG